MDAQGRQTISRAAAGPASAQQGATALGGHTDVARPKPILRSARLPRVVGDLLVLIGLFAFVAVLLRLV